MDHEPLPGPVVRALHDDRQLVLVIVVVPSRALDHGFFDDRLFDDRLCDSGLLDHDLFDDRLGHVTVSLGVSGQAGCLGTVEVDHGVTEVGPRLEFGIAHDLKRKMTAWEKA